ncbi:serine hydrolase domain-containing protein [Vagococcus fessus]|uniref:Serine hydrolase n=1 Tax=Vagococcus fessus TaxID=120370 RepID=A0A430A891_9ENTE|nr:serine hydrolase domain-containing protein [Vagococcus fessus]RSU03291.1 serine hydrolase [Vagococcus fessus]
MYPNTTQTILSQLKSGIFPGANFAFVEGNTIETHSYGHASLLPNRETMLDTTLFDVASLTKVIGTNSVILKLIETEQLDIDLPITFYLPAFHDKKVTSRHLLTHTSDINPFIKDRDTLNKEELRAALLLLKSGPNIGSKVAYTDTGTLLLGFLIEKLYNKPVQHVIEEDVLRPLRLNKSTFKPDLSDSIAATENHPKRGVIRGAVHDPKAFVLGENCGSAGLFSTLEDCLTFCQMILSRGNLSDGSTYLKEETITSLLQDWTPSGTLNRSLGWDLKTTVDSKRPLLFHTGYTGTFLLIDPKEKSAFIFLSNRVHPVDNRANYIEKRDHILEEYLNEKATLTKI